MAIVFGIIGFILGFILEDIELALVFAFVGSVVGAIIALERKLGALSKEVTRLREALIDDWNQRHKDAESESTEQGQADVVPSRPEQKIMEPIADSRQSEQPFKASSTKPPGLSKTSGPSYLQAHILGPILQHIKNYFSEGNLFVRIGMLVLFFGVAFLLKYATEHSVFSIELRISAIVLAAISMLYVGWRLRVKNRIYALILQGGSIGVLYMTFYAAYQMYQLIPSVLAFALMFVLAICSAMLAVYQNARVLAVLGAVGGFLAPLLASSGSDNYIGLFSYYVLLNLGILTVAWFKSWRILNLIGFMFTYVIAGLWGVLSYDADKFWTTEPFLVSFFLIYISVTVLYALRQSVNLKAYVDATLLFGNPLLAFGYQLALTRDFEYGVAISAFVLGMFYVVLGRILWRQQGEKLRMVVESCLAMGIVFITLAIPFALDANWTTAAWALEAAGILWVGFRQGRKYTPVFAILLQLAAAVMFIDHGFTQAGPVLLANASFIGCLIIASAGVFSAWLLQQQTKRSNPHFLVRIKPIVYLWGLGWWLLAILKQVDVHFIEDYSVNALISATLITVMLALFLNKLLNWHYLRLTALAMIPALSLIGLYALNIFVHPLDQWGYLFWLPAFACAYALLRYFSTDDSLALVIPGLHIILLWTITVLLTLDIHWRLSFELTAGSGWQAIYWLVLILPCMMFIKRHSLWPFKQYAQVYMKAYGLPALLLLVVWMVVVSVRSNGEALPLAYIPLLNPLDMMQLIIVMFMLGFWRQSRDLLDFNTGQNRLMLTAISAMAFLWINMLVVRLFHQYFDIVFVAQVLWKSESLQSTLSILWSVLGMLGMVIASRRNSRTLWLVGAGLITVVIIKLVTVDLIASDTIERIVSFIVVGFVLVIMGYFSPIPSKSVQPDGS